MQNIGQSKSLSSRVAEQIENLIREGKFTSGQQIPNETQLQQQMNVGRGAVREAIKILVAKNMLEVRRGQGTFVVENPGVVEDPLGLSLEKDQDKVVRDLHQVRCELEPLAAKLAAKNITEEEQTTLKTDLKKLIDAYDYGENVQDADIQLHTDIARASHNVVLARIIPMLLFAIRKTNLLSIQFLGAEEAEKFAKQDHTNLVNAICVHDPEAAKQSMYEQLAAHNQYLDK